MRMSNSSEEAPDRATSCRAAAAAGATRAAEAASAAAVQFETTLRHDLEAIKREYADFLQIEDLLEGAVAAAEQQLEQTSQRQQQQKLQHEEESRIEEEEKEEKKQKKQPQQQQRRVPQERALASGVGSVHFRMRFVREPQLMLLLRFDRSGYTLLNADEVLQQQHPADDPPLVEAAAALRGPCETIEQLLLMLRPRAFEQYQVQHVAAKLLHQ